MLAGLIREAPLRDLYGVWWHRSVEGRRLPDRGEMDMLDLPAEALPHAFIYEHEHDGRFRCRLAGTCFVEELGYEPTGQYLDGMLDPVLGRSRVELYGECVGVPRAIYYRARLTPIGHEHRESGRLLLPVAGTDGCVRFVFGGMMVLQLAEASLVDADADGMIEVHRGPPVGDGSKLSCG